MIHEEISGWQVQLADIIGARYVHGLTQFPWGKVIRSVQKRIKWKKLGKIVIVEKAT